MTVDLEPIPLDHLVGVGTLDDGALVQVAVRIGDVTSRITRQGRKWSSAFLAGSDGCPTNVELLVFPAVHETFGALVIEGATVTVVARIDRRAGGPTQLMCLTIHSVGDPR